MNRRTFAGRVLGALAAALALPWRKAEARTSGLVDEPAVWDRPLPTAPFTIYDLPIGPDGVRIVWHGDGRHRGSIGRWVAPDGRVCFVRTLTDNDRRDVEQQMEWYEPPTYEQWVARNYGDREAYLRKLFPRAHADDPTMFRKIMARWESDLRDQYHATWS